jgi:hypothetical protein
MTKHNTPPTCNRCGTIDDVGPVRWIIEGKEIVEYLCHDCDDAESAQLSAAIGPRDAN